MRIFRVAATVLGRLFFLITITIVWFCRSFRWWHVGDVRRVSDHSCLWDRMAEDVVLYGQQPSGVPRQSEQHALFHWSDRFQVRDERSDVSMRTVRGIWTQVALLLVSTRLIPDCQRVGPENCQNLVWDGGQGILGCTDLVIRREVQVSMLERNQERRKSGMVEHVIFSVEPDDNHRKGKRLFHKFRNTKTPESAPTYSMVI